MVPLVPAVFFLALSVCIPYQRMLGIGIRGSLTSSDRSGDGSGDSGSRETSESENGSEVHFEDFVLLFCLGVFWVKKE